MESIKNQAKVEKFSYEIVWQMIEYIYTSRSDHVQNWEKMFCIANMVRTSELNNF